MRRENPRIAAIVALITGLWPIAASAQLVQPFLPVPPLPSGPEAPAVAQEPFPRGQTVTERRRPEVDAQGVRFGELFFFPRAELDAVYNDNVFATATNKTSAFETVVAPSFDLLSNFRQDGINLHAGAAIGTYASHTSENYQDAFASADGHVDIDEGRKAYGGLEIQKLHESRYSPDSPGTAAEPVKYMTYGGNAGYAQTGLKIGYSADLMLHRYEFEAPPRVGGGFVPQSDRNMTTPELALRGSYEVMENTQAYIRAAGNIRSYDHGASATSPIRNSAGYRIDVGGHFDLTGVTVLDLYVGYLEQDYQSALYNTLSGIDVGAKVTWNATTLDTVQFNTERTIQDLNNAVLAPGLISPGYLHTIVGVSEDHELLRNLLLNVNASYINDDFKGIDRTDNGFAVGGGAKYLLNRYLYLGGSYSYSHRSSSGRQATTPYSDNLMMLRLSTQL